MILINIQKYDGYQNDSVSMIYKVFNKMSSGGAVTRAWPETLAMRAGWDTPDKSDIKNKIKQKQTLLEELQ